MPKLRLGWLLVLLQASVCLAETTATQYLMTTSRSANVSTLHVINTAASPQTFTGTLFNQAGDQLGPADLPLQTTTVAPRGRLILTSAALETLFEVQPWTGPATLVVKGQDAFELMSRLVSPSGLVSNTNCVRENRVLNIEGTDSDNRTFIRFINDSDSAMGSITGTLYNSNGDVVGNPGITLLESLKPRQAQWINRDELASLAGDTWEGVAMLEVNPVDNLKLLNLNFVNNETFLNFSCFQDSDSRFVYLQTTSNSLNVSETHLVNTSDSSDQYTGTLFNQAGQQLGDADVPLHDGFISPHGRLILSSRDLETRFNTDPWKGPALLQVNGRQTFELMTRLTSPSGLISNSNCVARRAVHNIEGSDANGRTFVRFLNQGDNTISDIRGTLYNSVGSQLGQADTLLLASLAPREAVWINRTELAALFNAEWEGAASLITSAGHDADLRMINLNFVNNETFFNFSCYENSNTPPVVTASVSDQSFVAGSAIDIAVSEANFSDSDGNLDISVQGLPDGLTFDGNRISGTAETGNAGTYNITVVATDDALNTVSTRFRLEIIDDSYTPGTFIAASNFEARCANPRFGIDPFSNAPYPDRTGTYVDENNWLRSWTNDLYLWYDEVIDRDPVDYSTPVYFELQKTLETTDTGVPKDNFHFATNTQSYLEGTRLGESVSYGAAFTLLSPSPPRDIRIAYVEPDSPAAAAGLDRGARILTIDGVDVAFGNDVDTLNAGISPSTRFESHTFTVRDLDNSTRTIELVADVVTETRVQNVQLLETDSGPVGYMLFNSHFDSAEPALVDAFRQFRGAGITDLVLDIRYNQGGLVGIAAETAYMIAGAFQAFGRIFIEYQYNEKYRDVDPFTGRATGPIGFPFTTIGYGMASGEPLPTVNLERVFLLTTGDTCSASELIINSLRGIGVEVIQIGGTTCGKPYGFVPTDNCGTTYFSIQFRGVNALGFGDYVEGFSPSASPDQETRLPGCSVEDDFNHLLGDTNELLLSTALYYRDNGTCPSARPHRSATTSGELMMPAWRSLLIGDPAFNGHGQ